MTNSDPYSRLQYRRLIAWPKRIEREWPLLEEVLGAGPSRRVLDLGCGTGEHARFLVEKGFEVVGVDASESMIDQALDAPLPAGLRFVRGDLAELESLVDGRFGGAICLGNTLPHLRTKGALEGFLRGLRARLLPGAPVVLQLLNYERIFALSERHLPLNFRHHEDGESVFLRLMEPREDGRVLFFPTTLRFRPEADQPVTVVASKRVELMGWRLSRLEGALEDAGFAERRLFGAFDRTPFEPLKSRDLLVVAR
ncbi:MAG: class I SAM-dependent methyltransferase [bacterium]|nr:class I SAM-dependent methyltransferase [bacterium]